MYKLKTLAQRSAYFAAAVSMLSGIASAALPAFASADALNPLTERSLMLSSSSPGYHFKDGSGNDTYSPAGSGNNGKKTGETFTFKMSSAATIKAFTLQYCTTPAGYCESPGNDWQATTPGTDDASHTDLNVNFPSPVQGTPANPADTENFEIFTNGTPSTGDSETSASRTWTMTPGNLEDDANVPHETGKNNLITLTNSTGITTTSGEEISIVFYGTDANFITNPGAGAFFVKINTYSTDQDDTNSDSTGGDLNPTLSTYIVDGGVTVANVMNDSIQIQTKVLETMSFSVGTHNPDTTILSSGSHGTCDAIDQNSPLSMGDPTGEYSLEVQHAYDTFSYWRLSSNSSNGATVYYSGYTLSNTEGDHIRAVGTGTASIDEGDNTPQTSHQGTEQFGLALTTAAETVDTAHSAPAQTMSPLSAETGYGGGAGLIDDANPVNNDAEFSFDKNSLTTPRAIASEGTDVIHCSTGKMRYVANIAPDTPAGVYTSRINYIASPEY